MGDGAAYNYVAMRAGDRRCRPRGERRLQRAHRRDHGLRRAVRPKNHDRGRRRAARRARRTSRAVHGTARRCARPSRRRSPPRSASRASTIRSRRPARLRRIASATAVEQHPCRQAGRRLRRRWRGAGLDAVRACSTPWAQCRTTMTTPSAASSAPMTSTRDGFVIAGGGGMVVLEELEHARPAARRSTPRWPATARPPTATTWSRLGRRWRSAACSWRCRPIGKRKVGYINPHGTSTPVGDVIEVEAIRGCSARTCRRFRRPSR